MQNFGYLLNIVVAVTKIPNGASIIIDAKHWKASSNYEFPEMLFA